MTKKFKPSQHFASTFVGILLLVIACANSTIIEIMGIKITLGIASGLPQFILGGLGLIFIASSIFKRK